MATLSDSLFSGKGRGDQEAFEGLHWGVGSLEGSLGLLSWDFHPWTVMNPSSLVEGAIWGVAVGVVLRSGGGGNFLPGLSLGLCSSSTWTCSSQETCLRPKGHLHLSGLRQSPPHHTLPWGPFPTYSVRAPSPPYNVVIFILQPMILRVSRRMA